jgi:heme/copper-type cytochrome/quinol oxidase subunit 2
MSLIHAVVLAAAAETEHNPLPMPPALFGIITLVVFAVLGIVMFSYRNVANRHRQVSGKPGGDGSGHGTAHFG